jgi:poly-beta-1,6-N-acetyl-D-glucosamine synthase
MNHLLDFANNTLFLYYLAGNLAYLAALVIALKTTAAHQRRVESYKLHWIRESPLAPPITLVAPAHNEEKSIRVSIRNLLQLDYPELEVIVVNDGS